ncbi:hypothetical protein IDJ75_09195 [Mucilaginibacter rigui]|uniref:SMI1/KNR4 family protein n=1 Tax=Mucilaginibacter rigui TaxID=534635 RepID=A0ABR7X4E5_9SPHI|nr:hypothetical protein [Mucilaginibacter rigui]MBD1385450.1 hypothetical protein [Mucilaginibacter rigui]
MNKIINNIIHLPVNHNVYGDVSIQTLLDQTGYNDHYKEVTVKDILFALNANPVLADNWLIYSSDKRSDSGWYILDTGDGKYQVGFYPETDEIPVRTYTDLNKACAIFIKQELESIRLSF